MKEGDLSQFLRGGDIASDVGQSRRYDGFDRASGLTQKFGPKALRVGPIVQYKPCANALERKA